MQDSVLFRDCILPHNGTQTTGAARALLQAARRRSRTASRRNIANMGVDYVA